MLVEIIKDFKNKDTGKTVAAGTLQYFTVDYAKELINKGIAANYIEPVEEYLQEPEEEEIEIIEDILNDDDNQ